MAAPLSSSLSLIRKCDQITHKSHRIFVGAVAAGIVVFVAWAGLTSLDKVTRGDGRVIPLTQNMNVQHLEGGIITDILVREGQEVVRGEALMRIENSFSSAELDKAKLEQTSNLLRRARLKAEAAGLDTLTLPANLVTLAPKVVEGERTLFKRRRASLEEQLLILDEQSKQARLSLEERTARLGNMQREREIVGETVSKLRSLEQVGAVSRTELLDQEARLQQIVTKLSDLEYQIPQLKSELDEVLSRRREAELTFRAEADDELVETELALAQLSKTILAQQDRSARSDVVAPADGRINRLLVSNLGGVVQPGQVLAQIVPATKAIAVEARLSPRDRAEVWPGLTSVVKISAYDYTVHGALKGQITNISPDALQDETGSPYFHVRIEADSSALGEGKPIVPGMLAEVDILTGSETVLGYLTRPLTRLKDNALRE